MEKRYGTPVAGNEKEILSGFLDHYRKTILDICEGLTGEQLRRPMVPSGTSLLSMVKHLAFAEGGWFQEGVANEHSRFAYDPSDPEREHRVEEHETPDEIFQLYREACEVSRAAMEKASLDDMCARPDRSADYNVRWVVVHMIEETARHAGHADILRELLDGKTGAGYGD